MNAGALAVIVLGAIVWGFAVIGIVSVARAIGPTAVPTPKPLLSALAGDNPAARIATVPAFPGATPSEYRQDVYGTEIVTEIEYLVDSGTREVREHYRDVLERYGWNVTESGWVRGEWTFALSLGSRHGTLEIEGRDGITELEIEIAEPNPARGGLTDR